MAKAETKEEWELNYKADWMLNVFFPLDFQNSTLWQDDHELGAHQALLPFVLSARGWEVNKTGVKKKVV